MDEREMRTMKHGEQSGSGATAPSRITLVPIPRDGVVDVAGEVGDVVRATVALYDARGFVPPWTGYVAVEDNTAVGTCAFTSPAADGSAEIAYHTFPAHEGRGVATAMAAELLAIAKRSGLREVTAQTLPTPNVSTKILTKLGFTNIGTREHIEDGTVWQWKRIVAPMA